MPPKVRFYPYKWLSDYKNCYAVRVKKGKNNMPGAYDNIAVVATDWVAGKVGKPYSILTDKDSIDRFYCSKLVYRSYLSASRSSIDLSQGANIVLPMAIYYNSRDCEVIARYER